MKALHAEAVSASHTFLDGDGVVLRPLGTAA